MDILISGIGIIITSPIMLIIAIAVKAYDRGPPEPLVVGGQDLDADLARVQQIVNVDGQQVLGFQRVGRLGLLKELNKTGVQQVHKLRGQRPHIHRDKAKALPDPVRQLLCHV